VARPKTKSELAYACPHTDKRNRSNGLCDYCYHAARRYSPEKRKELLARFEIRKRLRAHGVGRKSTLDLRFTRYGIFPDEWERRIEEQKNACAACGNVFLSTKRAGPHLDHNHLCCVEVPTCGECTRGILCGRCNLVLGMLEQEPHLLPQYLLDYLSKYSLTVTERDVTIVLSRK
jgi:hypothetical protein